MFASACSADVMFAGALGGVMTPSPAAHALYRLVLHFEGGRCCTADCDATSNQLVSYYRGRDGKGGVGVSLSVSPSFCGFNPAGFSDDAFVQIIAFFHLA